MNQRTARIEKAEEVLPTLNRVAKFLYSALEGGPVNLTASRDMRNLKQNDKLWAILTDVSRQVDWYGQKLTPEDWKHVFSASLEKQRAVPGIDGGFVVCGISTSKMSKKKFGDLLTIIEAFGSEQGVKWSDPALESFEEYRESNT